MFAKLRRELPLYIMILPGALIVLIYSYGPMIGIAIAFQKFIPVKGFLNQQWVGFDNFINLFNMPNFGRVMWNTISISFLKIVAGLIVPVSFALLLNEVGNSRFKRSVQTIVYMPYFLSWVILGGVLVDILSPESGVVNLLLKSIGIEPIFFLGSDKWFPFTLVITNTWKDFGFGTIIYLAALTNIDPTLYEAAAIDGAGKWKQTIHVTLPGIAPIVTLMTVLSIGSILNAGFDQVFNLYSPLVYKSGDILDTLVYRSGLVEARFGLATAAGLFKSVIGFFLVILSYKLADRFAGYRVF